METLEALPVTVIAPGACVCPRCGLHLPLARPVIAGCLRCPAPGCGARLQIRGGRVSAA